MLYALLLMADAVTQPLKINLTCEGSSMVGGGILDRGPPTQRSYVVQVRVTEPNVMILLPSPGGGITSDWQEAEQVLITDDQITGKLRTSVISKSKFTIDRRSGVMTSSGGFTGVCRKVEGKAF